MSKTKKFNFRVIQDNKKWTVEIIRRVTSKKNHISKSQTGFGSEAEAQQWAEIEVEKFVKNLADKNKRQSN